MNLRMLCKFELSRVEKAIAARLQKDAVDLLSVDIADRMAFRPKERTDLAEFLPLIRSTVFAEAITSQQVDSLVAIANRLVKSLSVPLRDLSALHITASAAPLRDRSKSGIDFHEYVLGEMGTMTGSMDNLMGFSF